MSYKDIVICGDCLVEMKAIPDKSVDMELCDLPYGVLNKNNKSAQWDSVIPFGLLWEQYNRIVKDRGVVALFGQGMFTALLMASNPKKWRYNLIWDKKLKSGFLNANRQPLRQHEDIVVFAGAKPTYNPQMSKCEPGKRNHSRGNLQSRKQNRCYGNFIETESVISDEKFPTSILTFAKEHIKGKSYHPTQKPVSLLEYLIRTYTNEGELVLDNTCGSGSTLVACVNTNRHYIGIEKEKEYYDIAVKRVSDAKRTLRDSTQADVPLLIPQSTNFEHRNL